MFILYCTRSTRVQYFLILWRYIYISVYMHIYICVYFVFSSVFLSVLEYEMSYTFRLLWRIYMYWVANVSNMPLKMFTRTNWSNVFASTESSFSVRHKPLTLCVRWLRVDGLFSSVQLCRTWGARYPHNESHSCTRFRWVLTFLEKKIHSSWNWFFATKYNE